MLSGAASVALAPKVRRPGTREVFPRTEAPNFRDAGMMVDAPLLNVVASLQKRYGEAFASEAGLRQMIAQDTGHMPGVDTIPCALERLERQGLVRQVWLKPGGIKPDGSPCTYGTRLIFLPRCRTERQALQARARRQGETRRVNVRELANLRQAKDKIAKLFTPAARPGDLEERRQAALAQARALIAAGFDDPRPPKNDPD